eukprot:m.31197 g.31197  ORF g.31197 m.31197 type:complete len:292 (-) comp12045_c0_seq1:8-883(-)
MVCCLRPPRLPRGLSCGIRLSNVALLRNQAQSKRNNSTTAKTLPPKAISFSGCGWLVGFHFGVASVLKEKQLLTPTTIVAGASGGSLAAAAVACNVDLTETMALYRAESAIMLRSNAWRKGGCTDMLYKVLDAFLPDDCATVCEDRLRVAVQPVSPTAAPELIKKFADKADLTEALITSCHIPFYLDGNMTRQFRGETRIDGGLKELVPHLELPQHDVLAVCPLPTFVTRITGDHVDIGPHLVKDVAFNPMTSLAMVLKPPLDTQAERLHGHGRLATWSFLARQRDRNMLN